MNHITHWINGKPFVGEAQRHGRVFNPATREQTGEVDFATDTEATAAFPA